MAYPGTLLIRAEGRDEVLGPKQATKARHASRCLLAVVVCDASLLPAA